LKEVCTRINEIVPKAKFQCFSQAPLDEVLRSGAKPTHRVVFGNAPRDLIRQLCRPVNTPIRGQTQDLTVIVISYPEVGEDGYEATPGVIRGDETYEYQTDEYGTREAENHSKVMTEQYLRKYQLEPVSLFNMNGFRIDCYIPVARKLLHKCKPIDREPILNSEYGTRIARAFLSMSDPTEKSVKRMMANVAAATNASIFTAERSMNHAAECVEKIDVQHTLNLLRGTKPRSRWRPFLARIALIIKHSIPLLVKVASILAIITLVLFALGVVIPASWVSSIPLMFAFVVKCKTFAASLWGLASAIV
jgi:hypothetical protein